MSSRPIALIPISQHFSIRYFLLSGLLEELRKHIDCVILLGWKDTGVEKEFQERGYTIERLPDFQPTLIYRLSRRWVNPLWEKDIESPTTTIDQRRQRALEHSFRAQLFFLRQTLQSRLAVMIGVLWFGRQFLEWLEAKAFRSFTNWSVFADLIERINPDLIISATPFVAGEAVLCRVAKMTGRRVIASILSFDNLTSRGKIEVTFDHYGVWNRFMQNEAKRIYGVRDDQVTISGAPQMDFYAWSGIVDSRERFLERYQLDPARPILLLGAGPHHITPSEPYLLKEIDGICCTYPADRRPQILLRIHPVDDLRRWNQSLGQCRHVRLAPSWKVKDFNAGHITLDDIRELATVLAHTDIHISTSSTMTLDGAVFDKPQIGLAYDDRAGHEAIHQAMFELYQREHYLPITNSGAVRLVHSRAELAAAIRDYLDNPALDRDRRCSLVREVCGVPIGDAKDRVAQMIFRITGQNVTDTNVTVSSLAIQA